MSDFVAFLQLGLRHILDPSALDHVLFLLTLAAVYRPGDWRQALWVVSAFTVGHSITLALAVLGVWPMSERLVEFLIPVTIVAAAAGNLATRERTPTPRVTHARALAAGVFGLVHGAGFAGYLKSLFVADIAVPLLGFNVGIEIGQVIALAIIGVAMALLDAALRRVPRATRATRATSALRLRVIGVSVATGLVAAAWAVERRPW